MAKKQSLGKGLDVIFDDNTVDGGNSIAYLSLSSVVPKKNQPRKTFDMESLSDLASSIGTHGVLQPILVRDLKNGTYEVTTPAETCAMIEEMQKNSDILEMMCSCIDTADRAGIYNGAYNVIKLAEERRQRQSIR